MNEPNSYELSLQLHNVLVGMGRIVRMNTKDGNTFWVEYADKYTGKWKQIK